MQTALPSIPSADLRARADCLAGALDWNHHQIAPASPSSPQSPAMGIDQSMQSSPSSSPHLTLPPPLHPPPRPMKDSVVQTIQQQSLEAAMQTLTLEHRDRSMQTEGSLPVSPTTQNPGTTGIHLLMITILAGCNSPNAYRAVAFGLHSLGGKRVRS